MTRLITILGLLACLLACSCGKDSPAGLPENGQSPAQVTLPLGPAFPDFPADVLQPGESLDSQGFVIPERNAVASALGVNDEFQTGIEYFDSSGVIDENGVAATLSAAPAQSAWAIHRIPLGGSEPGLLSVDANLLANGLGGTSSYYVGVANYSSGRWDWRGPFTDNHVRLSLNPAAGHLSTLGNAFCAVLCYNGASIDLVGVSLALRDGSDSTAPAQVTGVGGPILGRGVDLQWDPVPAADLAGYAIYYSHNTFSSPDAVGVSSIGYLEGTTRHLLSVEPGFYEIRVAAVDISGNRGPLSGIVTVDVQNNGSLLLNVNTATTLASVGKQLSISVSGAELYDVDMDGDGIYETIGDTSNEYSILLSGAGIIRPRVRGYDALGTHVALGGLSVLVTIANLPPFADINASSTNVAIGQTVNFTAGSSVDLDGSIAKYEWDLDGNGSFNIDSGTDPTASGKYNRAGHFAANIRVTDNEGEQTNSSLGITVRGLDAVQLAESGSTSSIKLEQIGGLPAMAFLNKANNRPYFMQAQDSAGSAWNNPVKVFDDNDVLYRLSLAEVSGNPAMVFYDSIATRAKYVRADDAAGTSWGAPVIFHAADTGGSSDLTVINGNPAILHRGANSVHYTRASNANGTAWNATVVVDNTAGTGGYPVLLDTIERPTAVFVRVSDVPPSWRSSDGDDADGTTWGSVLFGGDTDGNNSYALDAIMTPVGSLAASFVNVGNRFELRSKYLRNVHINQWLASNVAATVESPGVLEMAMAGGLPFIVYEEITNHSRLYFVQARDQYGSSWEEPVLLVSYDDLFALYFSVSEADGRPVIAWQNNAENFISFGTIYH